MKSIEERAREAYPVEEHNVFTELKVNAYIQGAKEQKAIDDAELLKIKSSWKKKAYKWIKENTECGVHPQSAYGFADRFIKVIEE